MYSRSRSASPAIAAVAALTLIVQPGMAAQREVIETDWNGFRGQVQARKLAGRSAEIRFVDGLRTKAKVNDVRESVLVVRLNRDLDRWKTAKHVAEIPADRIASVRFSGKTGHARLIGSIAGAGGGAAIGGAITASTDVTEGAFAIIIPASIAGLALIGWLVGYFTGNAIDKPAPEFVLKR